MDQFKTMRGKVLNEQQNIPPLGKLWLAAADYHFATTSKEFVEEWGSIEDFQHDLFIFIAQTSKHMIAQGVKYNHWPIQP